MISNPTNGGWCRFDFGGVSQEIGDDFGSIFVPECIANALYGSMVNGIPVAVSLDDEGETTILSEGNEGCWFVIRDHYDTTLPNEGRDLTKVYGRPIMDVAEELIADLEKCPDRWEDAFSVDRGSVALCIEKLCRAKAVVREREAEYERRLAKSYNGNNLSAKQNKKADVCQSRLDWEQTPHSRKMISKSRSIDWEKRKFIIGFPCSGWSVFKLGDFEFTFSDCGGCSPATLLDLFRVRVSKKRRLHFCLSGEGPEFWFVETPLSR